MPNDTEILTPSEAAKVIGCHVDLLHKYARSGEFMPAIITRSGRRLYRLSDVLQLKAERLSQRPHATQQTGT